MKCQICQSEATSIVEVCGMKFELCGWCANRVAEYIKGNINHSVANILWGFGRVGWSECWALRDLFRKYKIKEVLEFGTGLSTELIVNEGIRVVSCDILKPHLEMYAKLTPLKGMAEFHWYPDSDHLPDFDKLYPNKKWEFVFVDGPQERTREARMAMKLSNRFIMLHDLGLGGSEFLPNEEWKLVEGHLAFFKKKEE